jgi:hypothetical protein
VDLLGRLEVSDLPGMRSSHCTTRRPSVQGSNGDDESADYMDFWRK